MYRPRTSNRDRAATIILVVVIHAALLFALLNLAGPLPELVRQDVLQVIDVLNPPPPPPPPPPVVEQRAKPTQKEGTAAPRNIQSKATPIVRVEPKVVLPVPAKVNTAPVPNTGALASQGASPTPGPGTGAGGAGTGTGGGGSGNGTGGGGGGGVAAGPGVERKIVGNDYPREILQRWPRGARVFVRVRVEASGRPSRCDVMRSFGDPGIDQWTCSLLMSRAVFRPATDARGQRVAAWLGYVQTDDSRFGR